MFHKVALVGDDTVYISSASTRHARILFHEVVLAGDETVYISSASTRHARIVGDPPAPSWPCAAGREGRTAVVCWALKCFIFFLIRNFIGNVFV